MPRSSGSPRTPARLSDSLYRRLNLYALAASAAGVGLLSPQALPAEIVYSPANVLIHTDETVPLDLNNDGLVDFELKDHSFKSTFGGGAGTLSALPAQPGNEIWGHAAYGLHVASALFRGAPVGTTGHFYSGGKLMANIEVNAGRGLFISGSCAWAWGNVTNRYLGLKFTINGQTHYGWARLSVGCNSGSVTVSATLTGYAYETVANRPILTGQTQGRNDDVSPLVTGTATIGEPATLGRLALGAAERTKNAALSGEQ
jgi:hypothetical protein